jgi:hypothetical protein
MPATPGAEAQPTLTLSPSGTHAHAVGGSAKSAGGPCGTINSGLTALGASEGTGPKTRDSTITERCRTGGEMTDKDIFKERERSLEEEYFRKHDARLIEKLRQRDSLEEIAKALAGC